MSRRKRDGAGTIYDAFGNNPNTNRLSITERMYLRVFQEIACARFEWRGLPATVDARYLEITLFNQALAVFYNDERFGYLALRATSGGQWNMYDNPTSYTVMGNTEVNKTLSYKECVPMWANFLRIPDLDIALLYATKLASIDRTIEINLSAMRKPFIVATNDENKLSLMNAFRQIQEGQPVIFTSTGLAQNLDDTIKVFDMRIDKDLVLNLQLAKSKLWNEAMTFLGINNANQDKRERLVVSEVSANNSQVLMARNVALDSRREACRRINAMFDDLDLDVGWNIDEETIEAEKRIAENVTES